MSPPYSVIINTIVPVQGQQLSTGEISLTSLEQGQSGSTPKLLAIGLIPSHILIRVSRDVAKSSVKKKLRECLPNPQF
jgi:hypothetical protein